MLRKGSTYQTMSYLCKKKNNMIAKGDIVAFRNQESTDLSGYVVRELIGDNQVIIKLVSKKYLKLQLLVHVDELLILF